MELIYNEFNTRLAALRPYVLNPIGIFMSAFLKKSIIAIFSVAILGMIVMKPFQTNEKPSQQTLVIGLQSGYPPFEFMDATGKIVGFDVEIAEIIAEKLQKALVIKDMEFEGEILSLKQGKIDLIISGMNITPSRLKEIMMVPYYGAETSSFSLVFWNVIPSGINTIEDIALLPNPTVSVQSGAISEIYLSRYANIKAKSFQGTLGPLMDVKYGKSVANLVEQDVAEYLKTQHPEIKVLNVPLPKGETIMGFGIGIKKDNQELFQQIQTVIQGLKASGELKQLEDKWFKGGRVMLEEYSLLIKSLPFLFQGALATIEIALVSIAIGLCGGIVIGVLNCNKMRNAFSTVILNSFIWIIRGTPLFVQVLIVYYALPEVIGISFSPFTAGVIALGINSMAYISEIVRGGINAIPEGQWDAAYVIGLKPWQTLQGIILPQMLRINLPGLTNELTALIKETSILMVIGVAELTKVSRDIVSRELDPMTIYLAAAVFYLVMTSSASLFAQYTQKRWHL